MPSTSDNMRAFIFRVFMVLRAVGLLELDKSMRRSSSRGDRRRRQCGPVGHAVAVAIKIGHGNGDGEVNALGTPTVALGEGEVRLGRVHERARVRAHPGG